MRLNILQTTVDTRDDLGRLPKLVAGSAVAKGLLHLLLMVATTCAVTASAAPSLLRDRSPEQRPQLLVVGIAHFANPGRDLVNTRVPDVLEPDRQKELVEVVERLAALRPTHVVVEWAKSRQAELDARYGEYLSGRYALGRSEVDQVGLRLAARAGLRAVHAVDWNGLPPGDIAEYDWQAYAEATNQGDRVEAIRAPSPSRSVHVLDAQPVDQWLRTLNAPESLAAMHRVYFDYVMLGDDSRQPGSNWVGHWYARNLRIFSNLVRITDDPRARIVVVYGAGHAYLLRQFARESGAFTVLDLSEWLSQRPGDYRVR